MHEGKAIPPARPDGTGPEGDLLTWAAASEGTPSESGIGTEGNGVLLGVEAETHSREAETRGDSRQFAINVLAGGGVNVVKIILQLFMLPLMAHLLGPAEFGVYALALPTVAFFMTLADGGLGASLAREPLESKDVWSTAFWLVLIVGISLSAVLSGWGIVLAQLSHEPRVASVMALLSISFLFVTSAVLPLARLTRERRLVVISGADLAGNLTGAAIAVTLAFSGAGAMSLAVQYVVTFFVRSIILNLVAFVPPSRIFRLSALTSHISTGSSLVCSRLADFSGRLAENLIFSRMFGAPALGTYTFANQVPRFMCEAASGPVWGSLYAHALRETDAQIEQLHTKLVHLLALLLSPMAFLASAAVPGLILIILGPTWTDAATIMSILIPFYALNVIAAQCGAILLAKGAGWTTFWLSLIQVVARVGAVLLGLWFGVIVVTWAIAGALLLYSLLAPLALRRIGISSLWLQLRAILAPVTAGALAGLACHFIIGSAPADIQRIALALLGGVATYVIVLVILQGRRLKEDFQGARRLIGR